MSLSDQAFLSAFENCTLPKTDFRHRGHLRVCWLYLSKHPFTEASQRVCDGIWRFASSLGAQSIYHLTLTLAWVNLVALAIQQHAPFKTFDAFIKANEFLLNKDLPKQYYSEARLDSLEAKSSWLTPDLQSFN